MKPPLARARWSQAIALLNRYRLHTQSGVSYAAQGLHIGDGITLRHGVVHDHQVIHKLVIDETRKRKKKA